MNITYYVYRIYQKMGDYVLKQGVIDSVVRYKHKQGIKLNQAEEMTLLMDVDNVIYGEMKLSEYIEKWGTIYVDEKFQKLFIKERPKHNNI